MECLFISYPAPGILPAGNPGRPGLGLHKVQLVELWALLQETGCWVVMAEKWGVEELVNVRVHPL